MNSRLKVLIFDLDDTLFDSNAAYDSALFACLAPYRVDLATYLTARAQIKATLPDLAPARHNRLIYFKRALELQNRWSVETNLKLMHDYERGLRQALIQQAEKIGRLDFLKKLSKIYRMYLVTNENLRTQSIKLSALDPNGMFFSGMITSEEVGLEKPHPRIFEVLLSRFQIKPQDSVMIGNDIESDLLPAIALGMSAIWSTEFLDSAVASKDPPKNIKTISSLDQLLKVL